MLGRGAAIALGIIAGNSVLAGTYDVAVTWHHPAAKPLAPATFQNVAGELWPGLESEALAGKMQEMANSFNRNRRKDVTRYRVHLSDSVISVSLTEENGNPRTGEETQFRDMLAYQVVKTSSQTGVVYDLRESFLYEPAHYAIPVITGQFVDGASDIDSRFKVQRKNGQTVTFRWGPPASQSIERWHSYDGEQPKLQMTFKAVSGPEGIRRFRGDYSPHLSNQIKKWVEVEVTRLPDAEPPKIPFEEGKYVADRRAVPDGGAVKMIRWTGELPPLERPLLHPNVFRIGIPVGLIGFGIALFFWRQRKR